MITSVKRLRTSRTENLDREAFSAFIQDSPAPVHAHFTRRSFRRAHTINSLVKKKEAHEEYKKKFLELLKSCEEMPLLCVADFVKKQMILPTLQSRKKTVIFELEQNLLYLNENCNRENAEDFIQKDSQVFDIKIRPHAIELLNNINEDFEVIVFTLSTPPLADALINFLDPSGENIHHRVYRSSCVTVRQRLVKDLRIFLNRKLDDIVIVDNNPINFSYQIDNGIPLKSWKGESGDRELRYLEDYLLSLRTVEDVREHNRRKFKLQSYDEKSSTYNIDLRLQ